MMMTTTTKNDTEYANTRKLVNHATNCKNLPTSHKASLSSSEYANKSDIWEKHNEELQETLLKDGNNDSTLDGKSDTDCLEAEQCHQCSNGGHEHGKAESFCNDSSTDFQNGKITQLRKCSSIIDSGKNEKRRDPWIPQPEQRDTVPNI
eukprot:10696421-Ditylum_brightwellii.AAC.1